MLGVPREPVISDSVPSDGLDVSEAVRRSGDVLLDGVSGEGDWLPLEEFEFLWDMSLHGVSIVASGGSRRACY